MGVEWTLVNVVAYREFCSIDTIAGVVSVASLRCYYCGSTNIDEDCDCNSFCYDCYNFLFVPYLLRDNEVPLYERFEYDEKLRIWVNKDGLR